MKAVAAALAALIPLSGCAHFLADNQPVMVVEPIPAPPIPVAPADCLRTPEPTPALALRETYPAREPDRSDAVITDQSLHINALGARGEREDIRTIRCADGLRAQGMVAQPTQ